MFEDGYSVGFDAALGGEFAGGDAGAGLDHHPAAGRGVEHERGIALQARAVRAVAGPGGYGLGVDMGLVQQILIVLPPTATTATPRGGRRTCRLSHRAQTTKTVRCPQHNPR